MAEPQTTEPADAVAALVERWFDEAFRGSAVARSTETWNCVLAAKDDLQRRLAVCLAAAPRR